MGGRSPQVAEPGAELPRSVVPGAGKWRRCGEVEGVIASDQRGAGEAGSPPPLNPLRDRGTIGGRDTASRPELRLGNTGSIRGWRDSSGGLPSTYREEVVGRLGGNLGGIGGGDKSLGGKGGVLPMARGFGGSGGGFPNGMGGIEEWGALAAEAMGPAGRITEILTGSSLAPVTTPPAAISSRGEVWKLGVTGVDTGDWRNT